MNEKDLAMKAMGGILKVMAIKWTVIIVTTHVAKRMAQKAAKS